MLAMTTQDGSGQSPPLLSQILLSRMILSQIDCRGIGRSCRYMSELSTCFIGDENECLMRMMIHEQYE